MVYIQLDFPSSIRNPLGQFGDASNKLETLYGRLARDVQRETATIIRAEARKRLKNPRKGRRGTLARVTLQQGNRLVGRNGFAVGRQSFLDRSEAKYARIIEEGSAVAAPRYSGSMISGGWRGNAAVGGQYFIPARAESRRTGLPRRDIQPLFAYSRAWEKVGAPDQIRKAWRDLLVGQGVAKPKGPLPKSYRLPVTFPGL
jgi:hypothetical protein